MQATNALTLTLPPLTPGSPSQPLGLAAATALGLTVDTADTVLHRVLLPSQADTANGYYSAAINGIHYHAFPGILRGPSSVPLLDWADQPIQLTTLRLLAIDLRPLIPLTDIRATTILTNTYGSTANVAAADTVTLDGKTYTYRTALTATEGDVLRGATLLASLENLTAAINHAGTPGTQYIAAAAHPTISASLLGTQITLTSLLASITSNLIPVTESSTALTLASPTLLGSTDPSPRGIEGTCRIELKDSLLPSSAGGSYPGILDITLIRPTLLTLAIPEGWNPNATGWLKVTWMDEEEVDPANVNAALTLILIGSAA